MEDRRSMVSKAKQASNAKWDKEHYEQIGLKVPKGTKDIIRFVTDDSVNGFIYKAIKDRIYRIEHNMEVDIYERE